MKHFSLLSIFFVALASAFWGCGKADKPIGDTMNTIKAIDSANFDWKISPGEDFYLFANGGWMKSNPIPPEFSRYGSFEVLSEQNQDKLKSLFEDAAALKNAKNGSPEQKIGDFFASGMDVDAINKDGYSPIKIYLDEIDAIKSKEDFKNLVYRWHKLGNRSFFNYYAGQDDKNSNSVILNFFQGGLNLPDRDYYLESNPRMKDIRDAYLIHIAKMLSMIGFEPNQADLAANSILNFESKIAKISRSRVDLRDPNANYNKFDVAKLQSNAPFLDWNAYFQALNLPNLDSINVGQPEFFKQLSSILQNEPLDNIKFYLKWDLLNSLAPYLSDNFVNENFNFYGKKLTGQEKLRERWKRVLNVTSSSLGELVGELYVNKYFPARAKERMLDLVGNLKVALKDHISNLEWMSDVTKVKALEKLSTMNVKIGYPDKWRSYDALEVSRNSYCTNIIAAGIFENAFNLSKIGKEVDRDEWHMFPQTVNAYYSPNMNEIVFPAAILQPPFFFLDADDAVNYGAIGVVIGHEMTHGFDDQGRQFDSQGNLNDWWTSNDAEQFKIRTNVLVDQYNSFMAIDSMFINGELTLGENIADVGGVTVALSAFKKALSNAKNTDKIDGFSPLQRFFLSYAQVWRQNIRDEELRRRIKEDVHSPGYNRVNGVLPNIADFYDAFDIKPGSKLYYPLDKRAIIW